MSCSTHFKSESMSISYFLNDAFTFCKLVNHQVLLPILSWVWFTIITKSISLNMKKKTMNYKRCSAVFTSFCQKNTHEHILDFFSCRWCIRDITQVRPVVPRPFDLSPRGSGRGGPPELWGSTRTEDRDHLQERPGVQQPPGEGPGEDSSEGGERFVLVERGSARGPHKRAALRQTPAPACHGHSQSQRHPRPLVCSCARVLLPGRLRAGVLGFVWRHHVFHKQQQQAAKTADRSGPEPATVGHDRHLWTDVLHFTPG